MPSGRQIERREAKHAGLRLEHSFLLHGRPRLAWAAVIVLLCLVAAAEFLSSQEIWFGPAYLAVLALAAWSLSSRIAIAIGLAMLAVRLATGTLPFYSSDSELAVANVAVRVLALGIVIGLIGMARRFCEREWRFARTDALTGALNRQAFFELVESDQGHRGWAALIYADLDGLKRLNDQEGHSRGDTSLKIFAETIAKTIRKGDVFARMGGDEFVIFMKLKNAAAGETVARRLHEAVNTDASGETARLACSLGVVLLPNGSQSIDKELRAADELMYEAKKSGAGVLVSTLVEREGKLVLLPPIAIAAPSDRSSAVRRTDRESASEEGVLRTRSRAAI